MSRYVVYDCDIGTDDAWGLLMLIRGEQLAEKQQKTAATATIEEYKIIGVTCVHGNTDVDTVTKNALRCLDAFDRTDVSIHTNICDDLVNSFFHFCTCKDTSV